MTKKLTPRRARLAYTLSINSARVWILVQRTLGDDFVTSLESATRLTFSATELDDMFTAYCWICSEIDKRDYSDVVDAELKDFVLQCYNAYCDEWDEHHDGHWTSLEAHAFANTSEEDMQELIKRRNMSSLDLYNAERMKALMAKES